jgi:hypothetical protein
MDKNTNWDEMERQAEMIVEIGRAILAEPLSEELQSAAPTTNEVFLTQKDCIPFGYADPLIPSDMSTCGTKTAHGVREQEELFCLHCASIFPAVQLKIDHLGNRCGCGSKAHPECTGAGFGVDLHNPTSEFSIGTMHGWQVTPDLARRMGYLGHPDERKETQ